MLQTLCYACHAPIQFSASFSICPRCAADNRRWQAWMQAGQLRRFSQFYLQSVWGWLAIISLLLPWVISEIFDFGLFSREVAILFLSNLLSLVGMRFFFLKRDSLWIDELQRRVRLHAQPQSILAENSLLVWGGLGFGCFGVIGGAFLLSLGITMWQQESLYLGGSERWVTLILLSLSFAVVTGAASIYTLFAYGQRCLRHFPPPIFLTEQALLRLAYQDTCWRIQGKLRKHKSLAIHLRSKRRTAQGGLNLLVRAEMPTQRVETQQDRPGYFLRAVQYWRGISDHWGRVTQLALDCPTAYIPDMERPYTLPENGRPPIPAAVEGDLITSDPEPTLDDAIIAAVVATGIKR